MYQMRSKLLQRRRDGLGYVAPGARIATKRLAPPPPGDITPAAPGSVFMSYGPGLRDRTSRLWGEIPATDVEESGPQVTYDIQGSRGLGNATRVVVQGSPSGASTGPPRVEVDVPQPRPFLPPWLLLAAAGALAYGYFMKPKPFLNTFMWAD